MDKYIEQLQGPLSQAPAAAFGPIDTKGKEKEEGGNPKTINANTEYPKFPNASNMANNYAQEFHPLSGLVHPSEGEHKKSGGRYKEKERQSSEGLLS